MTDINRRLLLAAAAASVAAPAFAQEAAAPESAPEAAPAPAVEARDFEMGDANAPIKFIEYASFTCSHCEAFNRDVFPSLKAEYIDTGKVHFTLREVYFDKFGFWAAQIARCDDFKRYEGMANLLFTKRKEWTSGADGEAIMAALRTLGLSAGFSNEQLDACLADRAMGEAMLTRFQANVEADKVEGTPTLIINGETHRNMSWPDLKAVLDEKLAG